MLMFLSHLCCHLALMCVASDQSGVSDAVQHHSSEPFLQPDQRAQFLGCQHGLIPSTDVFYMYMMPAGSFSEWPLPQKGGLFSIIDILDWYNDNW